MKRLEAQRLETERMEREAALGGLTGVDRTEKEGANRVADINANQDLDPQLKARQVAAAQSETNRQVNEEQKHSSDELAEKQQRAREDTEHIEADARAKLMSSEKQKTAAIGIELNERLQKYREELTAQEISQEDYNRRAVAAQEMANAEMVEAAAEARKKMGGEFDSLFKSLEHPKTAMADAGNKALGELAARLVQREQPRKGGAGATDSTAQGGVAGLVGGIFGKHPAATGTATTATHSIAQSMMSVAQATISVGSAMFTGMGGGTGTSTGSSAGGGQSGAWSSSGGGTSLLAAGSSGASGGFGGGSTGAASTAEHSSFSAGTAGATPPGGGGLAGAMNTGTQAIGFGKQMAGYFKGGGAGSNSGKPLSLAGGGGSGTTAAGNGFVDASSLGAAGSGSSSSVAKTGIGSNISAGGADGAVGAAQAGVGLFAQSQGQGGGGMLGGAEKGAQIGMEFGGPLGAAIGAAAGVVLAIKGEREQARVYDLKTVRPQIANDRDSYQQGSMDYMSAYSDMQTLIGTSWAATKKIGVEAGHYWNTNIKPEIMQAMGKLTAEEKAGRSQYTAQAASYATGTPYVPETGLNLNHAGERIFSSVDNAEITKAVTEGKTSSMPVQSPSMGDVHLHVHAIDAKGVADFMGKNKHILRAALNDSYAENSGGGMD